MRLLQDGITRQANLRPHATAIVFQQQRMSYGVLEEESNRLARCLRERGCQRGDRVAIMLPKSPVALVAMFATLKADAIYVPIDPAVPATRVQRILHKSGARWMVAAGAGQRLLNEVLADSCLGPQLHLIWLDAVIPANFRVTSCITPQEIASCSSAPIAYENGVDDPAHILFTSGSTGEPKGVVITHANVGHFVDWGIRYFDITAEDRNSGQTPLHFDLSTFDIYGTLTAGAELHLVPPETHLLPHKLATFIRDSKLTQWFSVPSILNYLAKFDAVQERDFPHMKRVLWCGEVLPTPALIYWMKKVPHVTFTNLYGPTEATIASSYYTVRRCPATEDEPIPIGTPCTGEALIVLDKALQPLPSGEIGDLYIAGVGLSPAYWEDKEKTAAAFVRNPRAYERYERLYKTGDLASIGEDGLFYFHGRADFQIKSRGYRIELGGIEAALNALGMLVEVAVVAVTTDSFEGTVICCAYVTSTEHKVTAVMLRGQLSKHLPAYMLPTRWQEFPVLPKNVNGKIDRRQLKEAFERREGLRMEESRKKGTEG